jgi:hypothetical protein
MPTPVTIILSLQGPPGPSGDAMRFDSQATAIASDIAGELNVLEVSGYAAPGDGGGGNYVRVSEAPTAYPGSYFESADGSFWQLTGRPNALQFGAIAGGPTGPDNSTVFANLFNFSGQTSSGFDVPPAAESYRIDTAPDLGTKNYIFGLSPDAIFSGAATTGDTGIFRAITNSLLCPQGPWILLQNPTTMADGLGAPTALTVEAVVPVDWVGGLGVVAFYPGISVRGSKDGWAMNPLGENLVTSTGICQISEGDGNQFSADLSSLLILYAANMDGTYNAFCGFSVLSGLVGGGQFDYGLIVQDATIGYHVISDHIDCAIDSDSVFGHAVPPLWAAVGQFANGNDTLFMTRFTDTSPTGAFISCLNAAATSFLFRVDVSGNVAVAGAVNVVGVIAGSTAEISGQITCDTLTVTTNIFTSGEIASASIQGENIFGTNAISAPTIEATNALLSTEYITAGTYVRTGAVAVANLPSAAAAGLTAKYFVLDSTLSHTAGVGMVVVGGGGNPVPVYSDSTNWRIG